MEQNNMLKLSIMNLINSLLKIFSLKLTKQPKKNSSMGQNKKKYIFAQRDVDDFSCIKLTEAPYSDIIYTYTNVKFASEENADGRLPLKFTYEVKKNPNEVDTTTTEFRNYIGDILIEVMEEQLENGTIQFK